MLEVQKYLIDTNGDFEGLNKTLGIKANFHENDERVILNYDQIESPKLNEIVRECRALTLNRYDYSLIAKSFSRFLNWGEGTRDEMNRFHWDNCIVTSKEDGSLISCHFWEGRWHIQTRNSYGDGYVNNSIYTWREIFEMAFDPRQLDDIEGRNYIFELCSPYNQVVQLYKEPTVYLLSIFENGIEWTHEATESFAKDFCLKRPVSYLCRDPFEVNSVVAREAERDMRYEGCVSRDVHNNRFKFKNPTYLSLSHLSNNGNIINIKHVVPIILKGEQSEMIAYFPYIEETVRKVEVEIEKLFKELDNNWFTFSVEKSKKNFAIGIQKCPLKSILFNVYGKSYEEVNLRYEMLKSKDNIIEYIKERL